MRILIVEDDAMLAFRMDDILSNSGHYVGFGWDNQTALEIASVTSPDLALVDLQLAKDASGALVARQLDDRFGIPAIFVSGSPGQCRTLAKDVGVLGCLAKPFSAVELITVIDVVENLIHGRVPTAAQLPQNFEFYSMVV